MKTRMIYGIAVLSSMFFSACKKEDVKPAENCRISSISLNGTTATNFTYEGQGRVSLMTTGNEITTYSYSTGGYLRQVLKDNKLKEKSSVENNALGLIQKITQQYYDLTGNVTNSITYTYEYNSNGEIVKAISKSGNNPEQTTIYQWSNGNLVNTSQGVFYSYYTDKPAQDGDILHITQLQQYGTKLIKNKNLVKSISQNSTTINVDNEFDSNGRIVKSLLGNDYYAIQHICQ